MPPYWRLWHEVSLKRARLESIEVEAGEDLLLYVILKNEAEVASLAHIVVRADGEVLVDAQEWVEAGSEETFIYTVSFSEAGSCRIFLVLAGEEHELGSVAVRSPGLPVICRYAGADKIVDGADLQVIDQPVEQQEPIIERGEALE